MWRKYFKGILRRIDWNSSKEFCVNSEKRLFSFRKWRRKIINCSQQPMAWGFWFDWSFFREFDSEDPLLKPHFHSGHLSFLVAEMVLSKIHIDRQMYIYANTSTIRLSHRPACTRDAHLHIDSLTHTLGRLMYSWLVSQPASQSIPSKTSKFLTQLNDLLIIPNSIPTKTNVGEISAIHTCNLD